jgi:hypothetical protein
VYLATAVVPTFCVSRFLMAAILCLVYEWSNGSTLCGLFYSCAIYGLPVRLPCVSCRLGMNRKE